MGFDSFNLLFSAVVFIIYGSICLIAIIFTFFLDAYIRINDMLNLSFFSKKIFNPLEINFDWLDHWLMRHNRIIGPILIFLSVVDLKLTFDIIRAI